MRMQTPRNAQITPFVQRNFADHLLRTREHPRSFPPTAAFNAEVFLPRGLHQSCQCQSGIGAIFPAHNSWNMAQHAVRCHARGDVSHDQRVRRRRRCQHTARIGDVALRLLEWGGAACPIQRCSGLAAGGRVFIQCKNLRQDGTVLLNRLRENCIIGLWVGKHHIENLFPHARACQGLYQLGLGGTRPRPRPDFCQTALINIHNNDAPLLRLAGAGMPYPIPHTLFQRREPRCRQRVQQCSDQNGQQHAPPDHAQPPLPTIQPRH